MSEKVALFLRIPVELHECIQLHARQYNPNRSNNVNEMVTTLLRDHYFNTDIGLEVLIRQEIVKSLMSGVEEKKDLAWINAWCESIPDATEQEIDKQLKHLIQKRRVRFNGVTREYELR